MNVNSFQNRIWPSISQVLVKHSKSIGHPSQEKVKMSLSLKHQKIQTSTLNIDYMNLDLSLRSKTEQMN